MATLKVVLTLSSSTLGPDKLSVDIPSNLAVQEPYSNMAGIEAQVAGSIILDAVVSPEEHHVFIRNNDPTNFVEIKDTALNVLGIVKPSSSVFFTIPVSTGLQLHADTLACKCQFGFWSTA